MWVGEVIAGRYRLEQPLGSGGSSEVWRAVDSESGEGVAIKLPRPGREAEANPGLRDEAVILGALEHPHIVRVLDWGEDGGRNFVVMELLEGPTLRDVIRERAPLPDDEVQWIGFALADALAEAHARGLVHGDVKPDNVILDGGVPRLVDFGAGRDLAETLPPGDQRQIAGTLAYLAPEVLTGEPVSPQSDIYALGVTLYEVRAGRLPFAGGGGILLGSEGRRAIPLSAAAPGVDGRLESVVMESLASDPAWRPSTAVEVRERLGSVAQPTVRLERPAKGRGRAAAAGTVAGPGIPALERRAARTGFPTFDEWVQQHEQRNRPRVGRFVGAAAGLLGVVVGTAAAVAMLGGSSGSANIDGEEPEVVETITTDTPEATVTSTQPPATATREPTSTPTATTAPPTATPTTVPPTRTPVPATPTPRPNNGGQDLRPGQEGAGTVLRWYELVTAGRFDEAYALWSDRMKRNFPRQGNLDQRWANTASVSVNAIEVLAQSDSRMTVAIDFVEVSDGGARHRYSGTWELVAGDSGWLLDSPHF